MRCKVCGINDGDRPIYETLDHICSPCFAWSYNVEHGETTDFYMECYGFKPV